MYVSARVQVARTERLKGEEPNFVRSLNLARWRKGFMEKGGEASVAYAAKQGMSTT